MNRDNVLFGVMGILVGFIAGYFLHELMAARQPPRLLPGQQMAQAPPAEGGAAQGPSAAGGAGPAGPQMAQIQQLKQYVDTHPDDADAVLQLANLNFDIQSWQRARDLYTHYLDLKPGNPDVMTDLGVALRELGESQKALETFRRVEAMAPQHVISRFNEVVVLAFDLKDFPAAEKALAELRKLAPDNPDVAKLASEVEKFRAGVG